jgi:hypothetical protein
MDIKKIALPDNMQAEIFVHQLEPNLYGIALRDLDSWQIVSGSVYRNLRSYADALAKIEDKYI